MHSAQTPIPHPISFCTKYKLHHPSHFPKISASIITQDLPSQNPVRQTGQKGQTARCSVGPACHDRPSEMCGCFSDTETERENDMKRNINENLDQTPVKTSDTAWVS